MAVVSPQTLPAPSQREYEANQAKMRRGWTDFAEALVDNHQRRLYLAVGIATWTDYCSTVLHQSIRKTQRQIAAADLLGRIAAVDPTAPLPRTEGAARALGGLDPETAATVLHAAAESTDGDPTAAAIAEARGDQIGRPQSPERITPDAVTRSPALALKAVDRAAAALVDAIRALPSDALSDRHRHQLKVIGEDVSNAVGEQLRLFA